MTEITEMTEIKDDDGKCYGMDSLYDCNLKYDFVVRLINNFFKTLENINETELERIINDIILLLIKHQSVKSFTYFINSYTISLSLLLYRIFVFIISNIV